MAIAIMSTDDAASETSPATARCCISAAAPPPLLSTITSCTSPFDPLSTLGAAAATAAAAVATADVVTLSSGTLNILVSELKTERATPTPASSAAPAHGSRGRHGSMCATYLMTVIMRPFPSHYCARDSIFPLRRHCRGTPEQ